MVLLALFDREVGCRRAASAVFQEAVGRVGAAKGIDILTEADFFTLGVRPNAYLNIGVFVAGYD